MKQKLFSTLFALLLVISLIVTPFSSISYAETDDDPNAEEQADLDLTKDSLSDKDDEGNENNDLDLERDDNPETSKVTDDADGEDSVNDTNDDIHKAQVESKNKLKATAVNAASTDYDENEEVVEDDQIVQFESEFVRNAVKRELEIDSDDITVADMENVEEIYLDLRNENERQTISLKGLEHAVNLVSLTVSYTDIENPEIISSFKDLQSLGLYSTNIEDLSFLENLTELRSLLIGSTNVTDISALKKLTKMVSLDLSSTDVSDISVLEGFTELEYIDLSYTKVTDISPLKNSTKMFSIGLGEIDITDISVLENMQNLTEIFLYKAGVKDIKVLKKLPNLMNAVLDEINPEAYDFETLEHIINNDGIIGYDAFNWFIVQFDDLFPEDQGFKVDSKNGQVTAYVKDEPINFSFNQVNALRENNLTLEIEKVGVTTSIPSSAFLPNLAAEIKIEEVEKATDSLSNAYKFTITQEDELVSEFEEPITFTFEVNTENVKNVENLQVFYLNEATNKWENIGGKYDAKTNTVTATTNHFSTFAVFEAEEIGSDVIVTQDTPASGQDNNTNLNNENSSAEDDSDDENGVVLKIDNNGSNVTTTGDNGSALPNTATNMYNFLTIGFMLLLVGASIITMRRLKA